MKKGYTIREKIIMLFTAIFVIFSLIVLGNIIFNNTTLFNVTKPLLIVTFIIGYLFVIFLLYKILKKNKKKLLDKKILIIAIIFILLITIQVIYAYNSYTEYGWDCGKVLETAEKLLTNHEFDSIYYSQYYNNIFIVLLGVSDFSLFKLSNQKLFIPFGITIDLFNSVSASSLKYLLTTICLYDSEINIIFSALFIISLPRLLKCSILLKNIFTSVFLTATIYGILYFLYNLYAIYPLEKSECA